MYSAMCKIEQNKYILIIACFLNFIGLAYYKEHADIYVYFYFIKKNKSLDVLEKYSH